MNNEQFDKITKWQDVTFPKSTVLSKIKHLQDELIELKDSIIKDLPTEEILSEFADCYILLAGASSIFGMDYKNVCDCIDIKHEVNKKRQWGKPNKDGVVNHVKETKGTIVQIRNPRTKEYVKVDVVHAKILGSRKHIYEGIDVVNRVMNEKGVHYLDDMIMNSITKHYVQFGKATESDPHGSVSNTSCGLEYTDSPVTDKERFVTCKNCLRVLNNDSK